jgi:hypothetical protein
MRAFGVNYDIGVTVDGRRTRPGFVEAEVRRDVQTIARDLHATAIRVSGEDLDRLEMAGRLASEAGLELWFSPMPYNLGPDELVDVLTRAATIAERLRAHGEVVAVLGGELSLFASGFVPGANLAERIATMSDPATWSSADLIAEVGEGFARAKATQRSIAETARGVFGGPITYAAGTWEEVDWDLFDIVSVDAYRDASNEVGFREQVRGYGRFGKPVAITEFGCCTYTGASAAGGAGWMILDPKGDDEPRLAGPHERDEGEQVRYFRELMEVFDEENVDAAFWFSFAGFALPHRDDPALDLDTAAYGAVAVSDVRFDGSQTWEPKEVFHAMARDFARRGAAVGR